MEYETIKLRDGEAIEDFALRFACVVQRLADLRDPEPEVKAVKKYLRVVRPRYKNLVVSVEAFADLSKLSIEEITGTLKSSDDADEEVAPPPKSTGGKLLLTYEECQQKSKVQDGDRTSSSAGRKKDQKIRRGKGGGNGGGGGGHGDYPDPNKPPRSPCFKCHKTGHWARYCPNKPKKQGQAHLAQGEEDEEPMLLMAHTAIVNAHNSSSSSTPPPPETRRIEIQEHKVFAELGPREDRDPDRWVLDSGAMNHMTSARSAFAELDNNVHGTVRFGDGSVVEIEGRGSVVFSCKNGEHRAFTGVYYIPRLTADIISLGQLEEAGCRIVLDAGVLRIYEPGLKLLARVKRSSTRLYLLELKIGRPVCLSARSTEAA
jgi:hypothetical protein